MNFMHEIRNWKINDYLKILLILLALSGFMNIVAAASSLSNSGGGSWQYYKEITIRENSGSGLTDYQIPISLSSSNFPANGMSDGADIRFTDSNGNELSYWIESWDNVNSKAKIWVKVSSISANSNTIIRMYYANPSAFSASQPKNTMLIYEDMQTSPSGTLSGSAVYDVTNKWVQLTNFGHSQQKGILYYLMNPGNGFAASFEFWTGNGNGEALWLGAYDSSLNSVTDDITDGGYHFTFDEWQDRIAYTKSTLDNGVPISFYSTNNFYTLQWHRAKINFVGTTAKIYYDDSLVVDAVDTTYLSDKSGNYFYFGGWGGRTENIHRIRNIIVSKYAYPEPTLMFSIEQTISTATATPTVTPTATATPIATPIVTSTQKATMTPTPTSTIQIPIIKQRAQLQVTYEVGSLINDRITIKVFLKNVGDATASNINMTIEHSPELEPIAASGSEKIGNTISWTGELLPNTEHISEYSVKAVKGKDVEIPLKVTYAKMSREEKAKALGVSSSTVQASISPEDTETILMIIKILKALPGFELLLAISILFLVQVFLKK